MPDSKLLSCPDPVAEDGPSAAELLAEVAALREGLITRTMIGQATGILAGRFNIPVTAAWDVLARTSNVINLKLRDVARVIVCAHNGDLAAEDQSHAQNIADALPVALAKVSDVRAARSAGT